MMNVFLTLLLGSGLAYGFTLNGTQKGWKEQSLEVNINTTNCPSDIMDRLNEAFKLWNSVPNSGLKLSLGRTSSTTSAYELMHYTALDTPVVICSGTFSADVSVDGNVVAGVGFANSNGGNLTYGGLVLNAEPGKNADITKATDASKSLVIAHEIGHMLGLGHSSFEPALMYYSIGSKTNVSLSKDDWDGISYLYPRDELSKTNLAAGCGLIQNQPPNTGRGLAVLFLLLCPFIVYGRLRFKNYISV